MADKLIINKEKVTTLFDKIRTKAGVTGPKTFDEMNDVVDSIQTGGSTGDGKYHIRYLDIDGTILKEEWLDSGATLTPPNTPNYDPDYLVFDSWNYDIENTVVEDRDLDIGAIYNTIDNATYMFCRFTTNAGLNPSLAITGNATIDWGDGVVNTSKSHTYASEGEYVIKISGSFSFSTSSSVTLFGSQTKCKVLKKIYLSKNIITVNDYLVSYCNSLEIISLPNTINKFGERAFNSCYNLKNIIIPKNVTTIGDYCFYSAKSLQRISFPNSVEKTGRYSFNYCYLLNSICIPNNLTYIDQATFQNCYSLKSLSVSNNKLIDGLGTGIFQSCYNLKNAFLSNYNAIIPYGMYSYCHNIKDISIPEIVTSIEGSAFRGCFLLKNIKIPKNVTSIGSQAFYECFRVINYFILCETVPTLSGTDAFRDINNSCTMWVNDAIIEDLKVATNWSTYASYMKKLSDCPQDLLDEHGIERPEPLPEPSGFTATFQATSMYSDYGYYSVDGGNTWTQVTMDAVSVENVTEVMLKITAHEYAMPADWNWGSGGLNGSSANNEVISETITLTQDTTFEYVCYD